MAVFKELKHSLLIKNLQYELFTFPIILLKNIIGSIYVRILGAEFQLAK